MPILAAVVDLAGDQIAAHPEQNAIGFDRPRPGRGILRTGIVDLHRERALQCVVDCAKDKR
jgi:hypothetical protein